MATGATACGGSDDDDAGGAAKAKTAESTQEAPNTPEQAVRGAYSEFVDAVYAKDARGVCKELTAPARKQFGEDQSCVDRFQSIFKNQQLSSSRPEIVSMKVSGRDAEAMIKTGKSKAYPVQFVKRNGTWKVAGGWLGDGS